MPRSLQPTRSAKAPGSRWWRASFYCLAAILTLALGCESHTKQPSAAVVQEAPVKKFEWGMTLLKRVLRKSRPNGAEGLSVTGREVEYELIPPNDKNPNYTAVVTVVSKTSFLHGKPTQKKKRESKAAKESEILDPLAEKDDYTKFIDIAGTGPGTKPLSRIETRSLHSKSVFEMTYTNGRWKLNKQPEKKYEQLWFEYAFD